MSKLYRPHYKFPKQWKHWLLRSNIRFNENRTDKNRIWWSCRYPIIEGICFHVFIPNKLDTQMVFRNRLTGQGYCFPIPTHYIEFQNILKRLKQVIKTDQEKRITRLSVWKVFDDE